jgi:branched-chain amino acid transport system permease protein
MFLVASVGLVLLDEETIRNRNNPRELWLPPLLANPISLTGPPYVVTVTPMQLLVIAAAIAPLAALLLSLARSRFGKSWRAVSDDPLAAQLMGIDPASILRISAVIAGSLAGWSGIAVLVAYGNANHSMGLMFGLKAMVAAIAGGMGSVGGAIVGALVLVAIETAWVALFGGAYRDAAVFILLIGLLTLSPAGLLGRGRL